MNFNNKIRPILKMFFQKNKSKPILKMNKTIIIWRIKINLPKIHNKKMPKQILKIKK